MHVSLFPLFLTVLVVIAASPLFVEPYEPGGSELTRASTTMHSEGHISLEQVLLRVLADSPRLAAQECAVAAADARITQAVLLPNPEIALESENFAGSGGLDGFNAAESTAIISQSLLLGGKRRHRRSVAESDRALAGRELEASRLDVTSATTSAFYRVLAAQDRKALTDELLGLAERFAETVQKRVDAGKVSPVEATRARLEVSRARVSRARALRELEATRTLLAANWGSPTADFDRVIGHLPTPTGPPSLHRLRMLLAETPEATSLDDQVKRQRHVLELEGSAAVPDLTVSVGPRRFEETGESAWVAGITLPIPIFDRNQGARRAAELDLERTRREADAMRVSLEAELASAYERIQAVALEATSMSQEIVPAAKDSFNATETGYREGKLGFLDVLDAQRALFEARMLLLDSLEEYAIARTELERLIGQRLNPTGTEASEGEVQ